MGIDMRLVPPVTNQQTIDLVNEAVAEGTAKVPGTTCTVEITAERPYVEQHDDSYLMAQMKQAIRTVTGKEPEMDFFPGYTDSAVAAATTGNRNCMSYGPGIMGVTHRPNRVCAMQRYCPRCKSSDPGGPADSAGRCPPSKMRGRNL